MPSNKKDVSIWELLNISEEDVISVVTILTSAEDAPVGIEDKLLEIEKFNFANLTTIVSYLSILSAINTTEKELKKVLSSDLDRVRAVKDSNLFSLSKLIIDTSIGMFAARMDPQAMEHPLILFFLLVPSLYSTGVTTISILTKLLENICEVNNIDKTEVLFSCECALQILSTTADLSTNKPKDPSVLH